MGTLLTRYWFQSKNYAGIGVTAYSKEDAIALIKSEILVMAYEPNFESCIENIDIQELDINHVRPNMGDCTRRGVWFPNLNR